MERHVNNSKGDGFLLRSTTHHQSQSSSIVDDSKSNATTSSQVVLQWGNRKRLRCMKVQANDNNNNKSVARSDPVRRLSTRGVKSDNSNGFGHLNLRQRPSSSAHRILRNTDTMNNNNNNNNNNGGKVGLSLLSSPERGGGAQDKKSKGNNNNNNNNNGSYETAHDSKKGGGSSSGSDTMQAVWPPKFVIGLTNKEKEEDFLAIKGVKLPHRPKKRAKYIQRTLNLVSPGAWLCDLTLERYEVRERKVTKKRPRGLKAMGNMESDSE